MMAIFPSVIETRDEFYALTDNCVDINSIVLSGDVPRISLLLHTSDPRYVDFLRICDKETMTMRPTYHCFYYDGNMYIFCGWNFTTPANLNIEFIIPVNKYSTALMMMVEEPFIGLGFCTEDIKRVQDYFTLMAVPAIDADVITMGLVLNNLIELLELDDEARKVAVSILQRANLSL